MYEKQELGRISEMLISPQRIKLL